MLPSLFSAGGRRGSCVVSPPHDTRRGRDRPAPCSLAFGLPGMFSCPSATLGLVFGED